MNRFLLLGVAGLLAVGLTVGVTGFEATAADRDVAVSVVEDDQAFVGVAACELSSDGNGTSISVRVDNSFTDAVTVERLETTDETAAVGTVVGPGDTETFDVTVAAAPDEVAVHLDGESGTVEVTRQVQTGSCSFATGGDGTPAGTNETSTEHQNGGRA